MIHSELSCHIKLKLSSIAQALKQFDHNLLVNISTVYMCVCNYMYILYEWTFCISVVAAYKYAHSPSQSVS